MGWIPLAVYIVGWFPAVRILTAIYRRNQDPADDGFNGLMAAVTGFIWPLMVAIAIPVLTIYGLYRLATAPLPTIRLPRLRRRSDAEYIAELERQLGIKGDR